MPKDAKYYSKMEPAQLNGWRRLAFRVSATACWVWLNLFRDVKVYGRAHIPTDLRTYIVAANHTASIDPYLLGGALYGGRKPVAYMAKQELFDSSPLMGWYLNSVGTFSVNRNKLDLSTVKTSLAILRESDWALGLFPEGTRQKQNIETGQLSPAKRGVAYFAQAGQAPILPIAIGRFGDGGRAIRLHIGPLIPPPADKSDEAMGQTTHLLETVLTDLLAEARKTYEAGLRQA